MLDEIERSTPLGEIRNWRYEETNDGFKNVSISWKDLNTLLKYPEKIEFLLSFLYFDTDSHWTLRLEDYCYQSNAAKIYRFLTEIMDRFGARATNICVSIRIDHLESRNFIDPFPPQPNVYSVNFRLSYLLKISEMIFCPFIVIDS